MPVFHGDSLIFFFEGIFNLMIKVVMFTAVLVFYGLFVLLVSSFLLLVGLCTSFIRVSRGRLLAEGFCSQMKFRPVL